MPLLSAVVVAGAVLLIVAGIGHARHRSGLRAAFAAQRLLPRRLHGPIAVLLTVLELAVGGSVFATQMAPTLPVPVRIVPLAAQIAMFTAFAMYLSVVRQRRPLAPCGCFGAEGAVTWLVVVRAGLLAVGAAVALWTATAAGESGPSAAPMPPMVRLAVLAGGVVLAMASWLVPVLLAGPPAQQERGRGGDRRA